MAEVLNIGFVGAGRVAGVLAPALAARGYAVRAVCSRTREHAARLAALVQPEVLVCATPQEVAGRCGLVFITTPDDAIATVAASVRWRAGQAAVHCSGALSVQVLSPVVAAGGEAAGFHPLQTFASSPLPSQGRGRGLGSPLEGVTIGIEGRGPLAQRLKEMAERLDSRWIMVPSAQKALYHVAGVLASNYVVTLARSAEEILRGIGVPESQARLALAPLLAATVENIRALGTPGSLTGPVARGDSGTIADHLRALEAAAPRLVEAYRAMGRLTVPLAVAKGTVSAVAAERLQGLLSTQGVSNTGRPDPDLIGAGTPENVR